MCDDGIDHADGVEHDGRVDHDCVITSAAIASLSAAKRTSYL
jgi:hypothetical protein